MGLVEVCTSVNTLLSQLEKEKRGLQKIDENIKKSQVSNRFQGERNADRNFQNDGGRGGRNMNRGFFPESHNRSFDEDNRSSRKRPQETKTVFSRLSGRVPVDSDGEDEPTFNKKPRISSQVIRELPTKQEVLKAQSGDEVSKVRNRRMFGSLLGTLQKFKQEEIILKNKEDKKAQIEKKIEEQAKQEKENQKRERQNLLAEREIKKASIKALEAKMARLESFEAWEKMQKPLLNFIQTKWKPHISWLPKKMNDQAKEKYDVSRKKQEKLLEDKQKELKEELEVIEQQCLRNMKLPPGVKRRATSLSDTLERIETDVNQSMEHDESHEDDDDDEKASNDENEDDDDEPTNIVQKIKQEKDTEKKVESKASVVNVKIEKDVSNKAKERKRDSNSDSDSSSSEDERDNQQHSSDDEHSSQDEEPTRIPKIEENGKNKGKEVNEDKDDKPDIPWKEYGSTTVQQRQNSSLSSEWKLVSAPKKAKSIVAAGSATPNVFGNTKGEQY